MLSTSKSLFSPNCLPLCVFCGKQSNEMERHHSVHNEDPSLKINFLGIQLTAKPMPKRGYRCPFVTCSFVGLPAALYTHILTHVDIKPLHSDAPAPVITPQKRPLEDPFSPYPDTLVGGSPSNTTPVDKLTPPAPPSCPNTPLGDGETPPKKQRASLESPTTPLSPTPLPSDFDDRIAVLESYLNDYGGVCALHGLSSSLPHLEPHTDLRTCDLVNANFYLAHYRKTIRRYINKPTLCSSCGGCKRFEHPVWACDNDVLQDFWLGIPYLVFTIPAITQIVFNFLGVHYTDEITESIHSFGTWLYTPSTNGAIISSGYPRLYDLIHAFLQSASQLSTIDWAVATQEAAARITSLQPL